MSGPAASLHRGVVAAELRCELGEAPVWDAARGELIWVDIDRGHVHRRAPDGTVRTLDAGQPVGCAVPRADGGLALALRDGFGLVPPGGGAIELVAQVERDRPDMRMNDGACDGRGRLWAGTMSLRGDTRTAALYRFDAGGGVVRVLPGISVSNGIGWSPEGDALFHIDSPRRRVDVYDFDQDAGTLGCRLAVIQVPPELGLPDGLTVDSDGGVWVALWGGGAVQRFDREGRADVRLELPCTNVTSCCFGGADMASLFVTSAARGAAHEPLAGALFELRPGVRGLSATPFAG